jgi:hypothetical protein
MADPSPIALRHRRVHRPWRIAFIGAAVLLTVATHWPRLQLPAEVPLTDKGIHLAAFATFTVLLWQTQWIHRLWLTFLAAVAWAGLDELSQGIPGVNRYVGWDDGLANVMGVLCSASIIWALGPVGARANRQRLRVQQYMLDELFTTRSAWLIMLGTSAACAAPLFIMMLRAMDGRSTTQLPVYEVAGAWLVITPLLLLPGLRRVTSRVRGQQPCLACGEPDAPHASDADGHGTCRRCGGHNAAGQWRPLPAPSLRMMWRGAKRPFIYAFSAIAGVFILVLLLPSIHAYALEHWGSGSLLNILMRSVGRGAHRFASVVDITLYCVLLAASIRLYRSGLARSYDQAIRCRACGFDLRGSATDEQGRGRCSECGQEFRRSD